MIRCGWCDHATLPGLCSYCGRNPAVPYEQRGQEPPAADDNEGGRPPVNPGEVRHKIRLALKELGGNPTKAALAEHLGISERTLGRWQKLAG